MPGTPRGRFLAVLEHRSAGLAIVALGVVLTLPAVSSGFMSDDHLLLGALEGRCFSPPPWYDLYYLVGRAVPGQIAHGELPWWTAPHAKLHLVRPLPSALLALDHALFGDAAYGYHLHSIAWFAALLLLARAFFFRVLTRPSAALALFLFALSPNFALSSRWISARHLIVAAVAGAAGLLLLAASETHPRRRWFAALAFVSGLAAGEAGLGGIALWAAYEVLGPRRPDARRAARVAWPVLLAIAYLALYARVGGGTRDIDSYVDPLSHPLGFARALLHHVPMLAGNALWVVESALGTLWPGPVIAAGVAGVLLFAAAYAQTSSSVPDRDRSALRWLVPGAAVGTLGLAGGVPGGRELTVVGLGFAPLVASLVMYGWRRLPNGRTPWFSRAIVAPLAVMHVALGPVMALGIWGFARQVASQTDTVARQMTAAAGDAERVFVVAAADPTVWIYALARARAEHQRSGGTSCWWLGSAAKGGHTVTTSGPRRLGIETTDSAFQHELFAGLFRSRRVPLHLGDQFEPCGAKLRIAAFRDGLPSRWEVELDVALDDPRLALLVWRDGAIARITAKEIASGIDIAWSPGPAGSH